VESEPEEEESEEATTTAKEKFFHIVQFLYLLGKGHMMGQTVDVLSASWASTWAASVTADCCVGMPAS